MIHFANSASDAHDFSAFPQTAAGFANLPTVSYASPNDADNMTPTSDNGGGIPAGDAWVQANLSAYAAWAQANNSLLIVTFDENNTNPAVTYPDHVAAIVVGAGSRPGSSTTRRLVRIPCSPRSKAFTALRRSAPAPGYRHSTSTRRRRRGRPPRSLAHFPDCPTRPTIRPKMR
ncbi:alkaline phosphatase family protein [Bradyrhizobium sp. RDM12]